MKKVKAILIPLFLSAMFIIPVLAVNYSITTSTYTLAYKDFPSELAASSSASVVGGTPVAACVGVRNAGGECGKYLVGKSSYYKMFFKQDTYDEHAHFTMTEDGHMGNYK